jgi:LuxR family transcriptional regulator, maltose regulon positive regulatory protein
VSAQAQAPVLSTKLHPPELRDRLGRDALIARLTDAEHAKLAVIRAPAGWGKSTLMSQWRAAEADRRAFAWLTLDPHDSDAVRFWTYVIESLRRAVPDIGKGALALLRAPGVDLSDEMLPVLAHELGDLRAPVVLALEDYHRIEGDAVHASLRRLLDFLPPTVTIAIATRSDPPLPISRLRVAGEIVEVDAQALRFSLPETRAFLIELLELGLSDDDLRRLYDRTEGWPAGLYLAALSLGGRSDLSDFVAGFAGDERHIVDYLMEEMLAAQEPEIQRFMLDTAILDRLFGPLCDAVARSRDSAATLERLARSNLFVVALDERRGCYRYHHLLQACLQAKLTREGEAAVAELHRRAAGWHLEAGEVSPAIQHTIKAGNYAEARELIARHWAPMMLVTAGEREVEEWFAVLPDSVIESDLRLCVARSYINQSLGRSEAVARWTAAAETAPLPAPFHDGFSSARGALACVRAGHFWVMGDVSAAMDAAEEVLEAESPQSPWRGIGHTVLGLAYAANGDWSRARDSVEAWVEIGRRAGHAVPQISGLANSAAWSTELADWTTAQTNAERCLELSGEYGYREHWICAGAHFARARLREHEGDKDDAKRIMRRALALARRGAGPVTTTWMLTHLVRILVTCEDPAGARSCLEEARMALASAPDPAAIAEMFAVTERQLTASHRAQALAEPLSERELAVLRLLAGDLTQREVGAELYVSLNTVKSHSKSIFRKLGVSSRQAAVVHARELNLL